VKKIVPKDAILIPENAECVFKGIIFDVYQWQQKLFDGSSTTFEMLRRVDTVKAICVVDDKIIVLDEDQPMAPARGYEFPGGRVERGADSYLKEIQREVLEETGYRFANWKLVHVQQSSQHVEGFFYYFVATNPIEHIAPNHDSGEHINVEQLSFEQLRQRVLDPRGSMGYIAGFFDPLRTLDDLLKLPEFVGQEVDR